MTEPILSQSMIVVGSSWELSSARETFPADSEQFACLVDLPDGAADERVSITFEWLAVDRTQRHNRSTVGGDMRAGDIPETLKSLGIRGPLQPGRYCCSVKVGDRLVGSAAFEVEERS